MIQTPSLNAVPLDRTQESFANKYFVISSSDSFLTACKKATIIFLTACSLGFFLLPLLACDKLLNRVKVNTDSNTSHLPPDPSSERAATIETPNPITRPLDDPPVDRSNIEYEHITLQDTDGGGGSKIGFIRTKHTDCLINLDKISEQTADSLNPSEILEILDHLVWVIKEQGSVIQRTVDGNITLLKKRLDAESKQQMFNYVDNPNATISQRIQNITNFFVGEDIKLKLASLNPDEIDSYKSDCIGMLTKSLAS